MLKELDSSSLSLTTSAGINEFLMLEYLAYGAIGIAMATTILTFRLLTSEQKKEHPNESILKMIKWFMGLTVFFSIFFGVIEYISKEETVAQFSVESAAKFLSKSDSCEFVLNVNPGSHEAVVYAKYPDGHSSLLGELSDGSNKDLEAKKSEGKRLWQIILGSTTLGKVKVHADEYRLLADSTHAKHFKVDQWYALDESDFWFRINEISGKYPHYQYNVSYGEGRDEASIIENIRKLEYKKTDSGLIFLSQAFKQVRNDLWKRQYYVKFGAGLATNGSTSVQKLNVQVIALDVH